MVDKNKFKNPWKKLSSRVVYKNHWYKIREDAVIRPDKKLGTYTVLETRGDGVFIVAVNDKKEIYLIAQFRYPTGMLSWELPGGNTDKLTPLSAAKKELLEETGLQARRWVQVGKFQGFPGVGSEIGYAFLARGLIQTGHNEQEEEGILAVKAVSFKKASSMIRSGEISDPQTITAILQAGLYLGSVKI